MTTHYTAEQLVKMVASFSRPIRRKAPRWVVIRDTFLVGSTTAHEICRSCGLDPDEIVKAWPKS